MGPPSADRVTLRQLLRQLWTVMCDLPRFTTAPLYRRWHLRWGTTPDEAAGRMPGDELVSHPGFRATRAVTIDAPPTAVWPWLVQVGCLRAGWYSNDLLDNFGRPSARQILPELQRLEVGRWVPMSRNPTEVTAFEVADLEAPRSMLWVKPRNSWAWTLAPLPDGTTRLITRVQVSYDWHEPLAAILAVMLMELADFAMMRRMLLGIKDRAEANHADR
jgi:hypothetical protein